MDNRGRGMFRQIGITTITFLLGIISSTPAAAYIHSHQNINNDINTVVYKITKGSRVNIVYTNAVTNVVESTGSGNFQFKTNNYIRNN